MINYKVGNVLTQKYDRKTLLVHVVNDANGFGSGVAGEILRRFPKAANIYHDWYQATSGPRIADDECDDDVPFVLGQICAVPVTDNLYIVHMIAQSQPGGDTIRIGDRSVYVRPVRLECLYECLLRVASLAKELDADIVGPMFAGGLAGASFDEEVVPVIKSAICEYDLDITIYKLEE